MKWWIILGTLFVSGQLFYYAWYTPERNPQPISPSRFDGLFASGLCGVAYLLSLLRLPFAVLPYGLKLMSALALKKHYTVSQYNSIFEALRIVGDVINWGSGLLIVAHIAPRFHLTRSALFISILAEALRLFAEKGQMILSASWQLLPHRWVTGYMGQHFGRRILALPPIRRYCQYYRLDDDSRAKYVLSTLRGYAATNPEASSKLSYLSGFRLIFSSQGIRGGHVRDVARGEVFVHASWTSDPRLMIGQALRRTPWLFDPRYLRRPFYYRSESNRFATVFVLSHARYSPTYALYQFGHEIKAARYDIFYRVLRGLNVDIEQKVQADGTFSFDQGLTWLENKLAGKKLAPQRSLWSDQEVIADVQRRAGLGEALSALDIAVQYTYPLKYVDEVLFQQISTSVRSVSESITG